MKLPSEKFLEPFLLSYDLDILGALVSMNREAGNARAALPYARRIAEVLPDDQP